MENTTEEKNKLKVVSETEITLREFAKDYQNLIVTEANLKDADKARLALKNKRLEIQRTVDYNNDILKGLIKDSTEAGNKLIVIIKPVEDRLEKEVKAIKDKQAQALLVEENRKKAIQANITGISQRVIKVMSFTELKDVEAMERQVNEFVSTYNAQEFKTEFDEAVNGLLIAIDLKRAQLKKEEEERKEKAQLYPVTPEECFESPEPVKPKETYTPMPATKGSWSVPTKENVLGGTIIEPEQVKEKLNEVEAEANAFIEEAKSGQHSLSVMVNYNYASYRFHIDPNLPTDTQERLKDLIVSEVDNLEF